MIAQHGDSALVEADKQIRTCEADGFDAVAETWKLIREVIRQIQQSDQTIEGYKIAFVQIAGLTARRIVCNLRQGQGVRTGERFGLIRFGSRADVYLPDGVSALVAPGQRMVAGESVIADLASDEGPRPGETR